MRLQYLNYCQLHGLTHLLILVCQAIEYVVHDTCEEGERVSKGALLKREKEISESYL